MLTPFGDPTNATPGPSLAARSRPGQPWIARPRRLRNGASGHLGAMDDAVQRRHQESRRTVLVALAANAAILVVKAIGGVISGSSAPPAQAGPPRGGTAHTGLPL